MTQTRTHERYTVQSFIPPHAVHPRYRLWDEFHGVPCRTEYATVPAAQRAADRLNREYDEFMSDR